MRTTLSVLTFFAALAPAQDTPLTNEQVAVYRAFLLSYTNGASGAVNLANRTTPRDLSNSANFEGCLKGIKLEIPSPLQSESHPFNAELVDDNKVRLVDPKAQAAIVKSNDPEGKIFSGTPVEDAVRAAFASGLMTLSNIAFDKAHRYAILTFDFSCGSLCGHFGTVVMQKTRGEWKRTKRNCGGGVS
jgi:hypothetical protein